MGLLSEVESWFRHRGVPQVLPLSVRIRAALGRSAPLFVALVVLDSAWQVVAASADTFERAVELTVPMAFVLLLFVLAPVAAALAGWVTWRTVHRSDLASRIVGLVAIPAWVAVGAILAARAQGIAVAGPLWFRLTAAAALLGLIVLGVDSLIHWALRRTLRELWSVGPMVLRVLPVLMVAVLFLFFNAEIWQVAAGLDTARTFGVAGVLSILALLVVIVTARDELRPHVERSSPEDGGIEALLHGTPLAGVVCEGEPATLRPGERVNFLLVPIAAQSIQVALFGVVMLTFFIAFGTLAISDPVAASWMGRAPDAISFLDVPLGVSVELLRVSLILASFCALSFAASASTDRAYRAAFLEPILREARVNLVAQHAYRHLRDEVTPRTADTASDAPGETGDTSENTTDDTTETGRPERISGD